MSGVGSCNAGCGSRNPGCDLVNLGGERSSGTGVDTLEATGETAVHGAECSVNSSSIGSQSRPVSRDRSGLDPKPGSSVTSGSGAWDCGSNSMRSGHASTFFAKGGLGNASWPASREAVAVPPMRGQACCLEACGPAQTTGAERLLLNDHWAQDVGWAPPH
jgi:hypothetical protein